MLSNYQLLFAHSLMHMMPKDITQGVEYGTKYGRQWNSPIMACGKIHTKRMVSDCGMNKYKPVYGQNYWR